jgi:hypothetical protein
MTPEQYVQTREIVFFIFRKIKENKDLSVERNTFESDKELIKKMGKNLNEWGGMEAMQAVYYSVDKLIHDSKDLTMEHFYDLRNIEYMWHGIGEWQA